MPDILLIHGAVSRIPRRIVVPDDDAEIDDPRRFLLRGERALRLPAAEYHAKLHRQHVADHYGIPVRHIPSGRCAVLDRTGRVLCAVMADPDIDRHPDGWLVASDTLGAGDVVRGVSLREFRAALRAAQRAAFRALRRRAAAAVSVPRPPRTT
jgi:hypothetical protein